MRSKPLILWSLDKPEFADRAAFAWNRLSNVCYLHSFEMNRWQRKLRACVTSWRDCCCLIADSQGNRAGTA